MQLFIWRLCSDLRVFMHCLYRGRREPGKHKIVEHYAYSEVARGTAETFIVACKCGGCVRYYNRFVRTEGGSNADTRGS